MKFYSETLNKLFDTAAELRKEEAAANEAKLAKEKAEKEKKEARAKRAKEVDEALKAANVAQAKAIKLLREFTKDFGYYHTSYTLDDKDEKEDTLDDFFNILHDFLY